MSEHEVYCFASVLKGGKFKPFTGREVGKIDANGKIEGTDYVFRAGIRGGIAITENSSLIEDGEDLVNPATHERFKPTKKGTGFFSALTKTFIKPYYKNESESGD